MLLAIDEHIRRVGEGRVSIRGRVWTIGSGAIWRTINPSKPSTGYNEVAIPFGDLTDLELESVLLVLRTTKTPVSPPVSKDLPEVDILDMDLEEGSI